MKKDNLHTTDYKYIKVEIIEGAILGDPDSVLQVVSKFSPYLWVVLRNKVRKSGLDFSYSDIEDIRANVLSRFLISMRRFKFRSKEKTVNEKMFDSYCKTVIRHELRDEISRTLERIEHLVILPLEDLYRIARNEPLDALERSRLVLGNTIIYLKDEKLCEELTKLRPTYQKVIELSFFLGHSDPEISDLMHIGISSVYEYKHKAISELKKALCGNSIK